MPEGILHGGVTNAGAVVREGDEVLRPAGPHVRAIHALLAHLREVGFTGAPDPLGFAADGRERLTFIEGEAPRRPWPRWWRTDRTLATAAALLRHYHDAAASFVPPPGATWSADLADPAGGTLLCHNDVCPENVIYRDGAAAALIDFDFAAPGRAVYDLAQLAKMCVPVEAPADASRFGGILVDPFARLRIVADSYGLPPDRTPFVDALHDALVVGDRFVLERVAAGVPAFVDMWNRRGGNERAARRRAWYEANRDRLLAAVS